MTTYTVEWTIEIDASTPENAARGALILALQGKANQFDVYAEDVPEGERYWRAIDFSAEAAL